MISGHWGCDHKESLLSIIVCGRSHTLTQLVTRHPNMLSGASSQQCNLETMSTALSFDGYTEIPPVKLGEKIQCFDRGWVIEVRLLPVPGAGSYGGSCVNYNVRLRLETARQCREIWPNMILCCWLQLIFCGNVSTTTNTQLTCEPLSSGYANAWILGITHFRYFFP